MPIWKSRNDGTDDNCYDSPGRRDTPDKDGQPVARGPWLNEGLRHLSFEADRPRRLDAALADVPDQIGRYGLVEYATVQHAVLPDNRGVTLADSGDADRDARSDRDRSFALESETFSRNIGEANVDRHIGRRANRARRSPAVTLGEARSGGNRIDLDFGVSHDDRFYDE